MRQNDLRYRLVCELESAIARPVTHEAIAQIAGVSRSGVSSAAGSLQMKVLMSYARSRITLLNPEELEVFSCECYRILSRTINSLLPPDNRSAADRFTP
jgi:hypothetical protein